MPVTLWERLTRWRASKEAEARLPVLSDRRRDRLRRAQELADVARRTRESPTASAAPALILLRESARLALAANRDEVEAVADFAGLWQARGTPTPEGDILADDAKLVSGQLDKIGETELGACYGLVDALIAEAEAPERERRRLALGRQTRAAVLVGGSIALVAAVAGGAALATRAPDLAESSPYRLSSTLRDCKMGGCGGAFFHTAQQDGPWIEYDLGRAVDLRSVAVENRTDCCKERAAPLLVEVSKDQKAWTTVAKRDDSFTRWESPIRGHSARFVRLRVPRPSMLHLNDVEIR